jgi:hypothetical protein
LSNIPLDAAKSVWTAPKVFTNSKGLISNGKYTIDAPGMVKHTTGSLVKEKSQFLFRIDANQMTLDAAAYADKAGLWVQNQAKVKLNTVVGVIGRNGQLSSYITVTRTNSGFVHGWPSVGP